MFHNVLIVDDSKVSRMITRKIVLEVAPDIIIIEAANGEEAIDQASANDIDASIVDFHMPGISGLELVEELKVVNPHMVITLLTANIQTEIKERAEELGAGYLTKPPKKDDIESFLGL